MIYNLQCETTHLAKHNWLCDNFLLSKVFFSFWLKHKTTLEQLRSTMAQKEEISQRCHELDEQVCDNKLTSQLYITIILYNHKSQQHVTIIVCHYSQLYTRHNYTWQLASLLYVAENEDQHYWRLENFSQNIVCTS